MNSLAKIFFYLLFSVLIGAIVAPLAYWLIAMIPAHAGIFGSLIHSIQLMPFHRYVSRSIQVTALILLWPTIASLKIHHLNDLFLYHNAYAFRDLCIGIMIGFAPLWVLQTFFLWKGYYLFNETVSFFLLPKILLATIGVAIFEEFLFRGVLLGLCRHLLKNEASIIFTALLFSGVHFSSFPHTNNGTVHWWSGFTLLSQAGKGIESYPLAFGAFITLFIIGIILAWVTIKTESIFLAVGLHGAWIFGQQFFNFLAYYHVEPPNSLLPWLGVPQIHGMVPIGILPITPLLMTPFLLRLWLKRRTLLLKNG